jgi:hypothetical protein
MAFNLSGMTAGMSGFLIKLLVMPIFWFGILFFFIAATFMFLIIRRNRRLVIPVLEIVSLGNRGKGGFNPLWAGWFGRKLYLKGLWWRGEEVVRLKSGEIIRDFSTEDYQEINGKRGIVCYRHPLDANILVPINSVEIKNQVLLNSLAPIDIRSTSVELINDAAIESTDFKEKLMQFVGWALVVIFSLIAIIVITQMVIKGQKAAADLIVKAGDTCLSNAKSICTEIVNQYSKTSTAP